MSPSEYDKCVDMYADNLYRFALKALGDGDEAKDVVQESFLRMWEKRDRVVEGKEKSYLFTIGHHLIVDRIRIQKRYAAETAPIPHENGNHFTSDLREILDRSLAQLPELQRLVIMLRDYEGYSYREISEIVSLNESQVKVYIFRGRSTLRKMIGKIDNIL